MQMRDKIRYFTTSGAAVLQTQSGPFGALHTLGAAESTYARHSFSAPRTVSVPTHPDINERLWCAALAISQPLVRVFSISARKEGQSTVISPMEMTSSRYRATSVLNSWTVCRQQWREKTEVIPPNVKLTLHTQSATNFLFWSVRQSSVYSWPACRLVNIKTRQQRRKR